MKLFKSLGLFVSACLTCGIATAADHHVKWHDDGKVDLVMEDGTTISTTREELGRHSTAAHPSRLCSKHTCEGQSRWRS